MINDKKSKPTPPHRPRLLLINSVCGTGSTGRICESIANQYSEKGYEVMIAYGRAAGKAPNPAEEKYGYRIGTDFDVRLHGIITRAYDLHGFGSKGVTEEFLKWAEEYDPDILWLHNIHGYYINIEKLFKWIRYHQKRQEARKIPVMKVNWTLHDCWSFTGHCAHFTYVECDRWKNGCHNCSQKREYPGSYALDNSKRNWQLKRRLFTGVHNMNIIVPSHWLEGLVKQSFLREYEIHVQHNTVDTDIFKPTPSDFRQRNGLQDKIVLLGVSGVWNARKGYDDFIQLSKKLSKQLGDSCVIVLVGVTEKQAKALKKHCGIIPITHTENQRQLAEIYTAADYFINLTYEDNYPTVNLEARACGTPIITYNTGGSPEAAGEDAIVVERGDLDGVVKAITTRINRITNKNNF